MPRPMNKIDIEGRLTKAPVLTTLPSGDRVATFTVAHNESFTSGGTVKKTTSFFPVEVWGDRADSCAKHLSAGCAVAVQGKMTQEHWETEEGKKDRWRLVGFSVELLSKPRNNTAATPV